VTDYSVRYRCQGSRGDGGHCTRRGRKTKWVPEYWLCWQHVRMFFAWKEVGSEEPLFPAEVFRS
jgi:hypothetical protein